MYTYTCAWLWGNNSHALFFALAYLLAGIRTIRCVICRSLDVYYWIDCMPCTSDKYELYYTFYDVIAYYVLGVRRHYVSVYVI